VSRRLTSVTLVFVLGLAGCNRDAPTEATGAVPDSDNRQVELAGFAAALEDVESRILPTLGDGPGVDALAAAWGGLERAVSASETGRLEDALARVNAAAMQLRADTMFQPDLDVVLLVLEQIAARARGPAQLAAGEVSQPLPLRREP